MPFDASRTDNHKQLIVFTDLDGTLLDHETYTTKAAQTALARLREAKVPLIMASSKTAAEVQPLRRSLGFDHCPAIVENGAGILPPGSGTSYDQTNYKALQRAKNELPLSLRKYFTGFSDWTAEEVSEKTGLSIADAILAKQRQYSEPGVWLGNQQAKNEFSDLLGTKGVIIQQGGRFTTLSFGGNKAEQVSQLAAEYEKRYEHTFTVALGDASNDIDMLEIVDRGIIIPNPSHAGIPLLSGEKRGTIVRAELPGPQGWNQLILSVLDNPEIFRN